MDCVGLLFQKLRGRTHQTSATNFQVPPALVESCALKICCRSSRVSWTLAMQMTVGSLNPGFASYFPAVSSTTHRESESFLIIFFGRWGSLKQIRTGLNGEVAQQNAVVGISPARVWWQTFVIRGARAVISLWRKTGPASNSSAKKRVSGVTGRNGPNVQKPVVEEPPGGTGS